MVKITVESFSEDDLTKKYMDLARKETYDQRCDFCKMPVMLHKMACTRRDEINAFEYDQINKQWEMFLAE